MARQKRDIEEQKIMQRAAEVWKLRLIGLTLREIAEKVDVSLDTVRRDIERIKVEYPQQTVRELIAEQDAKLREMMKPQYLKALRGETKAADTMLKMMDHQAKLFGLYDNVADNGQTAAMELLGEFMASTIKAVKETAK